MKFRWPVEVAGVTMVCESGRGMALQITLAVSGLAFALPREAGSFGEGSKKTCLTAIKERDQSEVGILRTRRLGKNSTIGFGTIPQIGNLMNRAGPQSAYREAPALTGPSLYPCWGRFFGGFRESLPMSSASMMLAIGPSQPPIDHRYGVNKRGCSWTDKAEFTNKQWTFRATIAAHAQHGGLPIQKIFKTIQWHLSRWFDPVSTCFHIKNPQRLVN